MTTPDSPENPEQNPYGQPPAQPNPYGQAPPPPNPYGAPQESPYGQPQGGAYGQQPPYGAPAQPGYAAGPPKHPSATTAMVLGLVSLIGAFICLLPIFAAPFAWRIGAKAVREIDAQPGVYSGRDQANAGKIMGIIGTVLLALGVLALIAFIAIAAIGFSSTTVTTYP